MLENPDYVNAASRSKHRDALNVEIDSYTEKRTSAEWIERLNKAGVPSGRSTPSTDLRRPAGRAPAHGPAGQKKGKTMKLVGQAMTLSRTPSRLVSWPPSIGEHTEGVLKEFGFKANEIAALRKANAI